MLLVEFVTLMQEDLQSEWAHLRFYAHYSQMFTGPQAEYYSKLFQEHARSELSHVLEFAEVIASFGGAPAHEIAIATPPLMIKPPLSLVLETAARIETVVAENYATRLEQLDALEMAPLPGGEPALKSDKKYLQLFYEKQLEDSRHDALMFKRLAAVA